MAVRMLAIYDVDGWAYKRRVDALRARCPDDFEIIPSKVGEDRDVKDFQTILLLDYMQAEGVRRKLDGIRKDCRPVLIVCFNADDKRREGIRLMVHRSADFVICNSLPGCRAMYHDQQGNAKAQCIVNGVDLERFRIMTPIENRPKKAIWLASQLAAENKGLVYLQHRIEENPGWEFDLRVIKPGCEMVYNLPGWYNSASVILCASRSEATANTVLEGMACGCVPVTTPVGNVSDLGMPGHTHVVFSLDDPKTFTRALETAWSRGPAISAAARLYTEEHHNWDKQAAIYFELLREVMRRGKRKNRRS